MVYVGARSHGGAISCVCLDDEKVAYDATRHLLSLGHSRIAMVTGPIEEDCVVDRGMGYRRALQEAGIQVDEGLIVAGDWSASSGQEAVLALMRRREAPTAIFAQNDRMAMGVLRGARDLNLQTPSHLSVIGVDDMPLSSYFDPPLTTMRQDMPRIGQEAVRILQEMIEKKETEPQETRLSAQLIIRQSTSEGGGE